MQQTAEIPVVDVPMLLSDKFLQSKEFDQNASDSVHGTFLLCNGDVYAQ